MSSNVRKEEEIVGNFLLQEISEAFLHKINRASK
jgi:hypothetical protein